MRQQRRNLITERALDPGSLPHLELRLSGNSLAGAQDAAISAWTDTSGHGRDAAQATGANRPITSGSGTYPNAPTGRKGAGLNPAGPSFMTGSLPGSTIGSSLGHTFYAWLYQNAAGGASQVLWSDDTAGRPQLLYSSSTSKVGWRDEAGTVETAAKANGNHSVAWVFATPTDGSGICTVYLDGVSVGTHTWLYNFSVPTGYFLTTNIAPFTGVLYEFDFFSAAHSPATVAGVLAWGAGYWGF